MFLGMGTRSGVFGAPSDALDVEVVISVKNIFVALEKPSQPRPFPVAEGKMLFAWKLTASET